MARQGIYHRSGAVCYTLCMHTSCAQGYQEAEDKYDMGEAWIQKAVTIWLGTNVANVIYL